MVDSDRTVSVTPHHQSPSQEGPSVSFLYLDDQIRHAHSGYTMFHPTRVHGIWNKLSRKARLRLRPSPLDQPFLWPFETLIFVVNNHDFDPGLLGLSDHIGGPFGLS